MSITFQSLGVSETLVSVLTRQRITQPFPIQLTAIPEALAGRDIQGRAPTGSGKTLAFGLPLLSLVSRADRRSPRALVLVPTRELAEQIRRDLAPLAEAVGRRVAAIYGGVGYGPQKNALNRGVDILVATPGRLEDLIDQGFVDLSRSGIVILDEADRMADMGFLPAVRRILDRTPRDRQTHLFSATLDDDVAVLGREYQRKPVLVVAEATGDDELDVVHHFWRVGRSERIDHTARIIEASGPTIVFTRTRHGADRLAKQLGRSEIAAVAMHGGRSQSQRTRALRAFSDGRARALVATDVAARGIHVEEVDVVIHYDLANDHKDYMHRSGRTARAGATGTVVSLIVDGQEGEVRKIQRGAGVNSPIEAPRIDALGRVAASAVTTHSRSRFDRAPRNPGVGTRHGPTSDSDSLRIYVGNLPWRTTDTDLESLFAEYGTVERATISTQRKSGRSKGFGFVVMPSGHGQTAIEAMNGSTLHQRKLRVRVAY